MPYKLDPNLENKINKIKKLLNNGNLGKPELDKKDVQLSNNEKDEALYHAFSFKNIDEINIDESCNFIEYLAQKGANTRFIDTETGDTLLHVVARNWTDTKQSSKQNKGYSQLLSKLSENTKFKIDIPGSTNRDIFPKWYNSDHKNKQGNTAMHIAVKNKNNELLSIFGPPAYAMRKDGIDVLSVKDKEGKSVMDLARENQNDSIVALLDTFKYNSDRIHDWLDGYEYNQVSSIGECKQDKPREHKDKVLEKGKEILQDGVVDYYEYLQYNAVL